MWHHEGVLYGRRFCCGVFGSTFVANCSCSQTHVVQYLRNDCCVDWTCRPLTGRHSLSVATSEILGVFSTLVCWYVLDGAAASDGPPCWTCARRMVSGVVCRGFCCPQFLVMAPWLTGVLGSACKRSARAARAPFTFLPGGRDHGLVGQSSNVVAGYQPMMPANVVLYPPSKGLQRAIYRVV